MNVGSVFSGCGLLDFGLTLAGLGHSWLCESDPFRRDILAQRWPGARIYEDVRTVGADAERVDVIAGGFPCKGASTAGKRQGFDHPETVLWREMARAVRELRPRYVLVENVAHILAIKRGAVWGEVLGDLAALGYDTVWDCLPAASVGAPHLRDRVFCIAADTDGSDQQRDAGLKPIPDGRPDAQGGSEDAPHAMRAGLERAGLQGPTPDRAESASDADLSREDSDAPSGRSWPAVGERATRAETAAHDARHGQGGTGAASGPDGQRTREEHHSPTPDPGSPGVRLQPVSERRGGTQAVAGSPDAAPADSGGGRQPEHSQRDHELGRWLYWASRDDAVRRGVSVEWGGYEPAIRRWEAVHGSAPFPLVRRVDDRSAARVERSRLSALGDGVQVHLGYLVGLYIIERERERAAA